MATNTKKGLKKAKAKPRSPSAKKSQSKEAQTVEGLRRELAEALEQQTATSEILRVIASSPTDIQQVLDVVAEYAARLCDASDGVITRVDGEVLRQVAIYGTIPVPEANRINSATPVGRAIVERKTIHVPDLAAEIETEFLESKVR